MITRITELRSSEVGAHLLLMCYYSFELDVTMYMKREVSQTQNMLARKSELTGGRGVTK